MRHNSSFTCANISDGSGGPLPGHVSYCKANETRAHLEEVIEVAPYLQRRLENSMNVEHTRRDLEDVRQHRALMEACLGEFTLQSCKLRPILRTQELLFEDRPDTRGQKGRIEGFGQIVFRSKLYAAHNSVEFGRGGDHHDRRVFQPPVVLHGLQHLDAVHARHHDVEEHQIERRCAHMIQRLDPVDGLRDCLNAKTLQTSRKDVAIVSIVVDDEDASRRQIHGEGVAQPPAGAMIPRLLLLPKILLRSCIAFRSCTSPRHRLPDATHRHGRG